MFFIDPHCHMVSRTTADYENMAMAGVLAVSEPAFWAGHDRSPAGFVDYFRQLTKVEPKRAAQFGIQHYSWICLNPKEAEDLGKAKEVLAEIPAFLEKPTVLGVGEIGLNKNTANEALVFKQHVQMAIDCYEKTRNSKLETRNQSEKHHLILIHTPHLEDKLKGTRMILDMLKEFGNAIDPSRVLIDHVEEHTIGMVTPQRAVDMIEMHGAERLCVNAAADWGVSDPLMTHRTYLEARRRGHSLDTLMQLFYNNPAKFLGQSPRFKLKQMHVTEE
jgi:predicted metal-dependent TIM-barrel fold hydrolase